jgi:hypothetical protein
MSITAKFARKYTAKDGKWAGKTVRVYLVSSKSDEELQHYEESCGIYLQHDDDTGKPLWKTTDAFIPSTVTLEWNYDGSRVYPKFDTVSKLQSAIDSLGTGLLAQSFSQLASQQLMASLGLSSTVAAPVETPASVPQQQQNPNPQPELEPQVAEGETPFTDESDE